ncbi:MerR family transcriptional regulator [Brachybacterium sp.]|uniref:MerR family transcriptional regulator n=1 Tax=Brachybacterium sp. TaxID=1891286 RepID=UPI002ED5730E
MSAPSLHVRLSQEPLLSIGDLSSHTGVSHRSLRYYEEQGLLASQRTPAGHRRYDPEAVDLVLLVQRLFAAGLTSTEIRPVLPGLVDENSRTEGLVAVLREHRERLQRETDRQLDTIDILDEVIEYHGQR